MIAAGAAACAYAKVIGPTTLVAPFDPTSGGRRTYTAHASPEYTDTPGVSWSLNAALVAAGYGPKMRMTCSRLEVNAGQTHTYRMQIGGTVAGVTCTNPPSATPDTGMVAISTGLSGAITFGDWTTDGETAFVGTVTTTYEYARS